MCKYCENIDNVIDIACEKAKEANGTNPLEELFFPMKVANNGIFAAYLNNGKDLVVLFADGRIICFEGDNTFATNYGDTKETFKFCPMCGRKL